jgi:hypothetical protein
MNICCQIKPENLKDFFYLFGIFSTFIISVVTIFITFKNRKNTLRESLYKEQMNFISKLTNEFYNLHSDLSKLKNNHKIDIQETKLKIEKIFGVMFSNTHIGSTKILEKSGDTLSSVTVLISEFENENIENFESNFETYFDNYRELINVIRIELGVNSLSKENQKLFK